MSSEVIVGVDIGGTNIRIGAVDSGINLINEKIFSSKRLQGDKAVERLLDYLKAYTVSLQSPVSAISIGFPSTIDKERQTVINTPNLKGFNNVPVKPFYEKEFGIPVFINKDATMLLYYDLHKLKIKQEGIIAGIYVGTGIGNSIVIEGKELIGRDGVACELGHIPVPGRGDLCGCGLKGCIELYAGGKGLERICENEFPDTKIKDVFKQHGDSIQIQQFIAEIADAIVIEINILNPECVVLGGGVIQMKAFPKERLRQIILEKIRKPVPGDTLNIVFSDDDNPFNGVVGGALYAMKQLGKEVIIL